MITLRHNYVLETNQVYSLPLACIAPLVLTFPYVCVFRSSITITKVQHIPETLHREKAFYRNPAEFESHFNLML